MAAPHRLGGVAYVDERQAARGHRRHRALEQQAHVLGGGTVDVARPEQQAGIDGDDLESGAVALEGLALGEELRAVVGPAREDADGCGVALGADVLDVAHGHRPARRRDRRRAGLPRTRTRRGRLRALDVQAVQLLGVLASPARPCRRSERRPRTPAPRAPTLAASSTSPPRLRANGTTSCPRASSARTTWVPRKPVAPVTRTFVLMTADPAGRPSGTSSAATRRST